MRKFLSVLLVLFMVLQIIPIAASAEKYEEFEFDASTGTITGYTGTEEVVVIPEEIDGVIVKSIAMDVFRGNTFLKEVTIPDSVETLGQSVFRDCINLETVHISDFSEIKIIPPAAFSGCKSLELFSIPWGVEKIGRAAFSGSGLSSVKLMSVKIVDESAFSYCEKLSYIRFTSNLESIGICAFAGCSKLDYVTIPPNIMNNAGEFDSAYFSDCTNLEEVIIEDGASKIVWASFYNCTSLSKVTIPDTVELIEGRSFYNCTSLERLIIPESVTTIQEEAFMGCEDTLTICCYSGSCIC